MISPLRWRAASSASALFPEAVGPIRTSSGGELLNLPDLVIFVFQHRLQGAVKALFQLFGGLAAALDHQRPGKRFCSAAIVWEGTWFGRR